MRSQRFPRALLMLVCLPLLAVAAGNTVGRVWTGAAATLADTANPAATATRQAERTELAELRTEVADLRTQVARPSMSPTATVVPSPTATPTPVPPAPMNQPLSYRDGWTITVTDVTKAATVRGSNNSATAKGVYVVVNARIVNNEGENRRFPVRDLVLVDERGRHFEPAIYETIMVTENLSGAFPPSEPIDTTWVFDVDADVGGRFILESRTDPTFRVQLEVALRG